MPKLDLALLSPRRYVPVSPERYARAYTEYHCRSDKLPLSEKYNSITEDPNWQQYAIISLINNDDIFIFRPRGGILPLLPGNDARKSTCVLFFGASISWNCSLSCRFDA